MRMKQCPMEEDSIMCTNDTRHYVRFQQFMDEYYQLLDGSLSASSKMAGSCSA